MFPKSVSSILLAGCVLLAACANTQPAPSLARPISPQWVKAYGEITYYDPASIERRGDYRLVWELQDLVEPEENGTRSRLSLNEIDCAKQRVRFGLKFVCFTTQMARGDPSCMSEGPLTGWMPIADAKPDYKKYVGMICE